MKLLYQFGIILGITFAGEVLHVIVLMLICLCTKVVKLQQVKIAADFLIDIMPPMFIPAAVGIMGVWSGIKEIFVPLVVITSVSTVVVMVCTGKVSQAVIRAKKRGEA